MSYFLKLVIFRPWNYSTFPVYESKIVQKCFNYCKNTSENASILLSLYDCFSPAVSNYNVFSRTRSRSPQSISHRCELYFLEISSNYRHIRGEDSILSNTHADCKEGVLYLFLGELTFFFCLPIKGTTRSMSLLLNLKCSMQSISDIMKNLRANNVSLIRIFLLNWLS